MMNLKIFQIGGSRNDVLLADGEITPGEGKLAVFVAKNGNASGVSLHGSLPQHSETVSGEFTLSAAMALFCEAERHLNESRKQEKIQQTIQRHLQRHGLV